MALLDKTSGPFVKHLFAPFRTEIVGFAFVLALPLCGLLVNVHATDWIFSHHLTSIHNRYLLGLLIKLPKAFARVFNKHNGAWTVTFDNAEFGLMENVEESGDMSLLWEGNLSFTITIVRTLVES